MLEDTREVIISRKSKKDRLYNGQKKNTKIELQSATQSNKNTAKNCGVNRCGQEG